MYYIEKNIDKVNTVKIKSLKIYRCIRDICNFLYFSAVVSFHGKFFMYQNKLPLITEFYCKYFQYETNIKLLCKFCWEYELNFY